MQRDTKLWGSLQTSETDAVCRGCRRQALDSVRCRAWSLPRMPASSQAALMARLEILFMQVSQENRGEYHSTSQKHTHKYPHINLADIFPYKLSPCKPCLPSHTYAPSPCRKPTYTLRVWKKMSRWSKMNTRILQANIVWH